ncbi:MAG: 4-phosphopantoate--beta-alanine ligase [Candidatus Bathyarchaeota archaeon]
MSNKFHIPENHPRAESLRIREKLVEGFEKGLVALAGLIAHGRGECFDYILGEKTLPFAFEAEKVAVAMMLLSKYPVISVNGNAAALCVDEIVRLAKSVNAKVEVNLFYRSLAREAKIAKLLKDRGLEAIFGVGYEASSEIPGLSSLRRKVSPRGIFLADTVLLAIEDGDRTECLRKMGKNVIAIDLNPFSRTALWASVTIVDNVVRALPNMIKIAENLRFENKLKLKNMVASYNNCENLCKIVDFMCKRLKVFAERRLLKPGVLARAEILEKRIISEIIKGG